MRYHMPSVMIDSKFDKFTLFIGVMTSYPAPITQILWKMKSPWSYLWNDVSYACIHQRFLISSICPIYWGYDVISGPNYPDIVKNEISLIIPLEWCIICLYSSKILDFVNLPYLLGLWRHNDVIMGSDRLHPGIFGKPMSQGPICESFIRL